MEASCVNAPSVIHLPSFKTVMNWHNWHLLDVAPFFLMWLSFSFILSLRVVAFQNSVLVVFYFHLMKYLPKLRWERGEGCVQKTVSLAWAPDMVKSVQVLTSDRVCSIPSNVSLGNLCLWHRLHSALLTPFQAWHNDEKDSCAHFPHL